ncbi:hypothetical protein PBY51_023193 [Eleginops maclovinus]|uniref:Uncharacterized protein n=1 Tax=Eleginops maclovinus TaxID=56733 RepID=A0AAN8ADC0_ELEMC|nr:hypothetical protein PBY51_023193 [Eleginops maclovinus]
MRHEGCNACAEETTQEEKRVCRIDSPCIAGRRADGGGGGSWRFFCRHPGSVYSRHRNLKAVKRCSETSCRENVVPPPDAASLSSSASSAMLSPSRR